MEHNKHLSHKKRIKLASLKLKEILEYDHFSDGEMTCNHCLEIFEEIEDLLKPMSS